MEMTQLALFPPQPDLRLPGGGLKIGATVLNFRTLRKRAFAVDTHLLRTGQHLVLRRANTTSTTDTRLTCVSFPTPGMPMIFMNCTGL